MRLDQYIAKATARTRKESRKVIRRGAVTVDGAPVRNAGQHVTPGEHLIALDDAVVEVAVDRHLTVALNKPVGFVCATKDARDRTVFDLPALSDHPRRADLRCVGRLDKDTTGLLLLTTDGTLVHRLTHPKRGVEKRYAVVYEGGLVADAVQRFARGLVLGDGTICRPATLKLGERRASIDDPGGTCVVAVHEGRYHQVRRMLAACGAHVSALQRLSIGTLSLGPEHPQGELVVVEQPAAIDAV